MAINLNYWAISLCYNEPWVIRKSLERYYATKSPVTSVRHFLVDQHWPIGYASFRAELEAIAKDFKCQILDPGKNLGLARGFNWAYETVGIKDDSFIIGYDPDSFPVTYGWDWAIAEVFARKSNVAWASLWHPHASTEIFERKKGLPMEHAGPIKITAIKEACMNSVCGIRSSWLRKVSGVHEENPFYGGLEVHTWPRIKSSGMSWVFLNDYTEEYPYVGQGNLDYRDWKFETTALGKPQIPFEVWLKQKEKI